MDLFRRLIFKRFDLFLQVQLILTNPDESLVHRRTLNKPKSLQILGFGFANPYWFQKICFVDLFRRPFLKDSFRGFVFERFVLWIRFVKAKISKYLIRFVLEGLVYNPASLKYCQKLYLIIDDELHE